MTRRIRVPFLRVGQRLRLSDGGQFSETPPHDADQFSLRKRILQMQTAQHAMG